MGLHRPPVPLIEGTFIMTYDPDAEAIEHARRILLELPDATLDIFIANRVHGMRYRDIAKERRVPLWVVRRHMLRAIRHIDRRRLR